VILKKTFLITDLLWIGVAAAFCYGGLKLGFGSFHQPHAGFMPFLSGLVLGLLALADLGIGLINRWKEDPEDVEVWANINWGKLLITVAFLFIYTILFSTLGFTISTILLLLFLFRVMEPKPFWIVLVSAVVCTGLFYLAFKVGLDSQLPQGFLGF
jgi:hypothetical protein